MTFQTFTELMKTAKDLNGTSLSDEANKALLTFYRYWGNYLDPIPAFLAFLYKPMGMFAKGCYQITNSLEHVFNNLFKLVGLFGYLGNQDTLIGSMYHYLQLLGVGIFTALLAARALASVLGKRLKYKDTITHFMLVTLVLSVLPAAITKFSTAMANDMYRIETMGVNENEKQYSSLALQPIKNNVVDLKVLIDNDFDTKKFPMDDQGYIKPVGKNSTPVNTITDGKEDRLSPNFVSQINFGAALGTTDVESLEKLDEKTPGYKGLFLHQVNSLQTGITYISEHRALKGLGAFESVYPRFKVNWIGMFGQFAILMVLLTMMSIKVVKSVFETVLTAIIAPIQGYTSVESSKKFKELLMTIVGAIAGIFFEMLIMRVTLEVMRDLPAISLNGVAGLTGTFFDGLNMWEKCISSIIVYLGVFFGAMQGVTIIERWLGVSTGHSDTTQQLAGAMMMANATGAGVGALTHAGAGIGNTAMHAASQAPRMAGQLGAAGTRGIAAAGGGLSAASDAVKHQGLGNTVKAGMANAAEKAGNKVNDTVGGIKDRAAGAVDDSLENGYQSTKKMLDDGDTTRLPQQTPDSLKEDIPDTADVTGENRNIGLQYGSREELGLPNPNDPEPLAEGTMSEPVPDPAEMDARGYGLNQDVLGNAANSGGLTQSGQGNTFSKDVPLSASEIPKRAKNARERLNADPANQTNRGISSEGRLRQNLQNANGLDAASSRTPTPRKERNSSDVRSSGSSTSREHYQKSTQHLRQMNTGLQTGAQKMGMGSAQSHIRGYQSESDDD